MQGVSRQGHMPHEHGGGWHTFTLLHQHWTVGWRLGRVAIACTRGALRPLGLLATWPGVVLAPSSTVGVAARGRGDSDVVVCTGCEDCIVHLCTTPWVWLCQREGGGGGTRCLALVVVGGACPVTALACCHGVDRCHAWVWVPVVGTPVVALVILLISPSLPQQGHL